MKIYTYAMVMPFVVSFSRDSFRQSLSQCPVRVEKSMDAINRVRLSSSNFPSDRKSIMEGRVEVAVVDYWLKDFMIDPSSTIQPVVHNLALLGLRPATALELIQFLSQNPQHTGLCALGSFGQCAGQSSFLTCAKYSGGEMKLWMQPFVTTDQRFLAVRVSDPQVSFATESFCRTCRMRVSRGTPDPKICSCGARSVILENDVCYQNLDTKQLISAGERLDWWDKL